MALPEIDPAAWLSDRCVSLPTAMPETGVDIPRAGDVRADIQALGAIAIGAVMVFHFGPSA